MGGEKLRIRLKLSPALTGAWLSLAIFEYGRGISVVELVDFTGISDFMKIFQTGCAFIYDISMVDLVDLTEYIFLTQKFLTQSFFTKIFF